MKEVGPNVIDIIVSSDGSWNAVMESEETTEKPEDKTSNTGRDESPQPGEVLDLTQIDDPMDVSDASGTEDRKHSSMANAQATSINPHLANTNDANQSSTHIESDFWTGMYMSTFGLGSSNVQPNGQTGSSASTSNITESFAVTTSTTSAPQTGFSLSQYQQYQLGNYPVISDYGRPSAVPRHITRTASAVQALPAQTPAPVLQRSSSANASSSRFTPNGLSAASQASPAAPNLTTNRASPHQVPPSSYTSPLPQHPSIQVTFVLSFNSCIYEMFPLSCSFCGHAQNLFSNSWQQFVPFSSARPPQQNSGFLDPNQVPNMYRVSNQHQSSSQPTNFRTPQSTSPSPGVTHSSVPPSTNLMRPQSHAGVTSTQQLNVHRTGVASTQQAHLIATANRAVHVSVGASRAVPSYTWNPGAHNMPTPPGDQRVTNRATPPPQATTTAQDSADPNWRPAGRMRGALSGQAYIDALNRYTTQPTQQAQAARPISNPMPHLNNGQSVLPTMMADGTIQVLQAPNLDSAAPAGRPAGSNVLPNGSPGMH